MFNGEVFNIDKIIYRDRPWEVEAFNKQNDLKMKLEKNLY
jgi:hypothetical protein